MQIRSVFLQTVASALVLAAAAVADPATRTDSTSTGWEQEPVSFRGLILGKSLSEQVPECPKKKSGEYSYAPQHLCYQSTGKPNPYAGGAVIAQVYNLPDIGIDGASGGVKGTTFMTVALIDGKVETIGTVFPQAYYADFVKLLEEKYGPPHTRSSVTMQNAMGARFEREIVSWGGKNVSIVVMEAVNDIKKSHLDVSTEKYRELQQGNENSKRHTQKKNL